MNPTNPVSPRSVRLTGGFWKAKQDLVHDQVIPYQWKALNDEVPGAEPSHSVENFKIAAGLKQGEFYGLIFQDSDIGKWIEAAAFSLMTRPNPGLETQIDGIVEIIGQAQEPDGYLQTYFSVKAKGQRYTDFALGHEMYCGGHLMEGAVEYFRATGKRAFLDIMIRYADHLVRTFGHGPGQLLAYDGHPEIELALHKLADVTGNRAYRELTNFFVDERGKHPDVIDNTKIIAWPQGDSRWNRKDYYLDHLPVREQRTAEGHSVRAMYLYTAMADQWRHEGDESLAPALRALWDNTTLHHMYVTGGLGSQATGERFTINDDLPSDTAYTETCASIGIVLWAWRMTLVDPDRRYADVLERALYNGSLSGISLDGTRYFYVNPLEVIPRVAEYRRDLEHVKTSRVEWFGCSCCPPNIARTIASFGQYQYSSSERGVWAHQFAQGTAEIPLRGGSVVIDQTTDYPWDGTVKFVLRALPPGSAPWAFCVRMPAWCANPSLAVNGEAVALTPLDKGYAVLNRVWKVGDVVTLVLPMAVQFLRSATRIRETFGKVAVQRGPLIWCAEEVDNGADLHVLALLAGDAGRIEAASELGVGARTLRLAAVRLETESSDAYSAGSPKATKTTAVLVPYHLWGNRGKGEMRVWLSELRV